MQVNVTVWIHSLLLINLDISIRLLVCEVTGDSQWDTHYFLNSKFPVLESDPLTFFFLLTHNKFTPNFSQLFTSQKNILVRMSKFHFIFLICYLILRKVIKLVSDSICMSQYLTVAVTNTVVFYKGDTMQLDISISDKYILKSNNKQLL